MARSARLVGAILFVASAALGTDDADAEQAPPCTTWESEYALVGTVHLTDTPFGKGNGAHKVGPGRIVLRFQPEGRVSILSYSMRQAFSIDVTAFGATVKVDVVTMTRAAPDACGIAGEGLVKDEKVEWTTNVRELRTDGTLTCSGRFCGRYGVPEPGPRPIQIGPNDTRVRPFEFTEGWKTFIMPFTLATKTESPKQTSFLALTGREVRRTCVTPPAPCKR